MQILICDNCKKSFTEGVLDHDLEIQEFLKISFTGGYASVFGDGTHVHLDICQHCLFSFVKDLIPLGNPVL